MKFSQIREQAIKETKQKIRQSITEDILIIQAATTLETLNTVTNTLIEKLRQWYEAYNPETSHETKDNQELVETIANNKIIPPKETMGGGFEEKDIKQIESLAQTIRGLLTKQKEITCYIETKLEKNCPNILAILGTILTAKLLTLAGSLKKLAEMPASTIQLLGAKKALFRHLKQKTKMPKYGIIAIHSIIQKMQSKPYQNKVLIGTVNMKQGKIARMLANKIAIAAKIDYFKGTFIGDKLKQQIEKKIQ